MTTETPPESAVEPTTEPGGTPDQDKQGRRDQRTRDALKAATTERDELKERYERVVGAEVHRLLGERLVDVEGALKLAGREVATFVGSDGLVDAAEVDKFVAEVVGRLPALRRGLPDLTGAGQRKLSHENQLRQASGASWSDVFSRSKQR